MKIKKRMITIGIIMMGCLLLPNHVRAAALQANGEDPAFKGVGDWMVQIRQMQTAGGALGLTDRVNYDESNYDATKPETCNLTGSNGNLDIHMEKNTEYGALAILSASSYGNPNQIADGETTTGNKTGVVMKLNGEWVAAGSMTGNNKYINASSRYKNEYTSEYTEKIGDAILTLGTWHGSTMQRWLSCWQNGVDVWEGWRADINAGLRRSVSDSIFSYDGYIWFRCNYETYHYNVWWAEEPSRAVVVVGSGI